MIGVGSTSVPKSSADDRDREAEAALIAAARHDPAAFAPLYRAYFDAVYRYCLRSLGDRDAAADVTQEIFARALAALPRTRVDAFRPWLFAIAHNAIVDRQRQQTRRPPPAPLAAAESHPDPTRSPEETTLAAEARHTVHRYLAQLPAEQRAVVELRLADLSGPEVAAVLGRSVGSVKVAQHRAFRRLREMMRAGGDGDADDIR